MKNIYSTDTLAKTHKRLEDADISFYKIAKIIDEPESTIQNIFKDHCKYANERIESILKKINNYLDVYNAVEAQDSALNNIVADDSDLFIKLYALGLDSKTFTPDEKYKLAVAYKKLTDSKIKS